MVIDQQQQLLHQNEVKSTLFKNELLLLFLVNDHNQKKKKSD